MSTRNTLAIAFFAVVVLWFGVLVFGFLKDRTNAAQAVTDAEIAEAAKSGHLQELPPGKKLVSVTLSNQNTIIYLVRPMRSGETPEVYQLDAYEPGSPVWVIREHTANEKK